VSGSTADHEKPWRDLMGGILWTLWEREKKLLWWRLGKKGRGDFVNRLRRNVPGYNVLTFEPRCGDTPDPPVSRAGRRAI
jgi:hypothetical protein